MSPSPGGAARALAWGAGVVVVALLGTLAADPPSRFALVENSLLRAILLGLVVVLWAGRADLIRLVAPPTRRQRWLLLAIVAVGAAARFALEPLPLHAANWMEDLVGRVASEPEPSWYANGYGMFMRLFTMLGLDGQAAIFTGNRVAGLLGPLALYGVARALGGEADDPAGPSRALFAALLLALLPLHVRLSASETMQLVPSLFVLVAFVGFRGHARFGSRPLLAAGVLAFSFAVLTRADAGVAAAALPLCYAPASDRRRLRDPILPATVGAAILVAGPLAAAGLVNRWGRAVSPIAAARTFAAALAAAAAPHPEWALMAALGLAILVAFHRRAPLAWAVPLAAFAATAELAGFDGNFANRLQLLVAEWPWLLLLAAAVPASLLHAVGGSPGDRFPSRALVAAALFAVIAVAASRAPLLRQTWDQQDEWRFIQTLPLRAGPGSPLPSPPLVRFDREDTDDGSLPSLPRYLLPPGTRVASITRLLAGEVAPPALYYRGLGCYDTGRLKDDAPAIADRPPSMRPICTAVEERFRLAPLRVARITSPPFVTARSAAAPEIGLFMLERRASGP